MNTISTLKGIILTLNTLFWYDGIQTKKNKNNLKNNEHRRRHPMIWRKPFHGLSPEAAIRAELLIVGVAALEPARLVGVAGRDAVSLRVFALRWGLPPVLHSPTCWAKRREHTVSWACDSSGATFTTIKVFPLPLRQGSIRCVNLELRKGMCVRPSSASSCFAAKTSVKQDKLLFIAQVSFSLAPVTFDLLSLSEPGNCSLIPRMSGGRLEDKNCH